MKSVPVFLNISYSSKCKRSKFILQEKAEITPRTVSQGSMLQIYVHISWWQELTIDTREDFFGGVGCCC